LSSISTSAIRANFSEKKFSEEQQELVRLREIALGADGTDSHDIEGIRLGDHYTFGPARNALGDCPVRLRRRVLKCCAPGNRTG